MASYTARKNKDGKVISYQIKVARGRDKATGKQLTPYTMTYTPKDNWSQKAIERELQKVMGEFEASCHRGEVLTKQEEKEKAHQDLIDNLNEPMFVDYANQFIQDADLNKSNGTKNSYQVSLYSAMIYFKDYKLKEITSKMCKDYVTYMQTEVKNKNNGKPLSHTTLKTYFTVLTTLFQSAVDIDLIMINPMAKAKKIKLSKDIVEKKENLVYDEEQIAYILNCFDKEQLMWKALGYFLVFSGCRISEALGLKWSDIDVENNEVYIQRIRKYTAEKQIYTSLPKNSKSRVVPLNDLVIDILLDLKDEQERILKPLNIKNEYVFVAYHSLKPVHPTSIGNYFRAFADKYNLQGIHPHALRHTFATISIANGSDVVSVSKILGHSSVTITLNTYAHANEEAIKKARSNFDEAIKQRNVEMKGGQENEESKQYGKDSFRA